MSRRTKRTSRYPVSSVIAALSLTLFIFSAAVTALIYSRWLYYLDIRLLNIPKLSGMSEDVIRLNYSALMDYCQVFFRGQLVFPTLPMSQEAAIHFADCKRIFDVIQITSAGSLLLTLVMALRLRRGEKRWVKAAGLMCLILPVVFGCAVAFFWDRFFIVFHELVFSNDYWLFDPVTDPVILMLPDTYFLHCAVGILILVFLGAMICLRMSARRSRRRR